ncbi:MAG: Glutaredoxin-related protein, partial [uncultured Solirubrobacteraceae bacterium]
ERQPASRRDRRSDPRQQGHPLHEGDARAADVRVQRPRGRRAPGRRRPVRRGRHPARPAHPPGAQRDHELADDAAAARRRRAHRRQRHHRRDVRERRAPRRARSREAGGRVPRPGRARQRRAAPAAQHREPAEL